MSDEGSFKELKRKWDKILEKDGFKDIEKCFQFHGNYFKARYSTLQFKKQSAYFHMAGQFLNGHPFCSECDRDIWKLHSEGIPQRRIASVVGRGLNHVNQAIQRLRHQMQFESWNSEDDE